MYPVFLIYVKPLFYLSQDGKQVPLLMFPVIRASEIGSYLYCRRAWWYRKQGVESENRAELAAGTELHRQHGRKVIAAGLMRTLGVLLLLTAFILLAAYLAFKFI